MTGRSYHRTLAEELVEQSVDGDNLDEAHRARLVAAAQVHATIALTDDLVESLVEIRDEIARVNT